MQSTWRKTTFGYMQFLMNKTSRERIDLFTKYKCIAFCTNLLLQSRSRSERPSVASCWTLWFPCFDVFPVETHLGGERLRRCDFFLSFFLSEKADGSAGTYRVKRPPSVIVYCTRSVEKRLSNHAPRRDAGATVTKQHFFL